MKTDTVREYDLVQDRAAGLEASFDYNEKKLNRLSWCLVALCALTAFQVIAWGVVAAL